jgi:transcriptional regulator with XRE-family HTH domain
MRLQAIGIAIRRARQTQKLTQARLATAAGVSRVTLNQLEGGLFPDLGIRKVQAILGQLGLALAVEPVVKERKPDFVSMACTTASVSFKSALAEDELIQSLLSGKAPLGRRPHLRTLLDEGSDSLLRGLVDEVGGWTKPGRVEKNLARLARELGSKRDTRTWLMTD